MSLFLKRRRGQIQESLENLFFIAYAISLGHNTRQKLDKKQLEDKQLILENILLEEMRVLYCRLDALEQVVDLFCLAIAKMEHRLGAQNIQIVGF